MPATVSEKRYQFSRERGVSEPPDWNTGWEKWDRMWERAREVWRYHAKSEGFSVTEEGSFCRRGSASPRSIASWNRSSSRRTSVHRSQSSCR